MLLGVCGKKWFRIVYTKADAVVGNVDAAHRDIYQNERKARGFRGVELSHEEKEERCGLLASRLKDPRFLIKILSAYYD